MKKSVNKELFGIILFSFGFILLVGPSFTGAFAGVSGTGVSSLFGIVLMLAGGLLFADVGGGLEEKLKIKGLDLVAKLLDQNQIPMKPQKLISIARKCGYEFNPKLKEGTGVYFPGTRKVVTVIPRHDINKQTAKGILKSLYAGEGRYSKVATT